MSHYVPCWSLLPSIRVTIFFTLLDRLSDFNGIIAFQSSLSFIYVLIALLFDYGTYQYQGFSNIDTIQSDQNDSLHNVFLFSCLLVPLKFFKSAQI